jgi:hypothetical protein
MLGFPDFYFYLGLGGIYEDKTVVVKPYTGEMLRLFSLFEMRDALLTLASLMAWIALT